MTATPICSNDRETPDLHAAAAFVDPAGANLARIRHVVETITARALAFRATAAARPMAHRREALGVEAGLPEKALSLEEIEAQLEWIIGGAMNTHAPGFVAHMGACTTTMSMLGDFVTSALNQNMIGLELSPTLSLLEEGVTGFYARLFGLPDTSGGLMTTGGSLSNLQALTVARNHRLGVMRGGVDTRHGRPVAFASVEAHASMKKNAMLLGLGTEGLIGVPTDGNHRMDPAALREAIREARARGDRPFFVAATAGTTVTGSLDPIVEIADIAAEFDLWFHVDAAWGGALQLTTDYAARLAGIERADSITFCPQKLMLVSLSCSLVLFRDWSSMVEQTRIGFDYLRQTDFVDRSEVGIQGSRPAEVLKLWLSMLHVGRSTYDALIPRWIRLAESVASEVETRDGLELSSEPATGIVCFRAAPDGVPSDAQDEYNQMLQQHVLESAGIYLSLVRHDGKRWLRAVFQNPYFDDDLVERMFRAVDDFREPI